MDPLFNLDSAAGAERWTFWTTYGKRREVLRRLQIPLAYRPAVVLIESDADNKGG